MRECVEFSRRVLRTGRRVEWTRRVKCSPKDDLFSESHRVTCVRIVRRRGEWNPSMVGRKYVYEIVAGEERNYAFF